MDGTLIHHHPHILFIQEKLNLYDINMTKAQLAQSGRWSYEFWKDYTNDELNSTKNFVEKGSNFWIKYLKFYTTLLNIPSKRFQPILIELAELIDKTKGEHYIEENTHKVLKYLIGQGFYLSVLSNRFSSVDPALEQMDLRKYFEVTHSASDLGVSKPEKDILKKHVEHVGCSGDQAIYIEDN